MTIPEILGFLITLIILGFMFLKQLWEARERRANPEEYQRKQREKEKQLKEFMKTLNIEDEDDEEEEDRRRKASRAAKHAQKQVQKQAQKQQAEKYPSGTSQNLSTIRLPTPSVTSFTPAPVTRQQLDSMRTQVKSKGTVYAATREHESIASELVQNQRSLRDAILLCEIIGPPKGRSQ